VHNENDVLKYKTRRTLRGCTIAHALCTQVIMTPLRILVSFSVYKHVTSSKSFILQVFKSKEFITTTIPPTFKHLWQS